MDKEALKQLRSQIDEALGDTDFSSFQDKLLTEVSAKQRKQIVDALVGEVMQSVNSKMTALADQIQADSEKDREMLTEAFKGALEKANFNIPEITIPKPEITVNVPEIKFPTIPTPQVTVEPAKVVMPNFPKQTEVGGFAAFAKSVMTFLKNWKPYSILEDVDSLNPVPVRLVDASGNSVSIKGSGGGSRSVAMGFSSATEEANNPLAYGQLTVSTSAVGLSSITGGIPAGAIRAVITSENDTIRWRDDGTAPTSTSGMPVVALQTFELPSSGSIANFQAIRDANSVSTVTLSINFYKR